MDIYILIACLLIVMIGGIAYLFAFKLMPRKSHKTVRMSELPQLDEFSSERLINTFDSLNSNARQTEPKVVINLKN